MSGMSAKMAERQRRAILTALLQGHTVVRSGQFSWRWSPRWDGQPSLANPYVSALQRADYLEIKDDKLTLTPMGSIIAKEAVS